jgi:pyruvate formate lyase activating enzyme
MKEALLYEKLENNRIHCFLCAHNCQIQPDSFGICGVRQNIDGTLFTHAWNKLIAENIDPIEKKPLYHFLPGTKSYSVATIGCNFKCGFCQNWQISQLNATTVKSGWNQEISSDKIIQDALRNQCRSISFTYTEPTIFFEYALDIAQKAKAADFLTVFVTNGFMTTKALDTIRPSLDACNVDLKSFNDTFYKKTCKARLEPVLESIRYMYKLGIWIEITTLVITGENDSEKELTQIAEFIASVNIAIPWHISRFFPNYQFTTQAPTPLSKIHSASAIGKKAGLLYVYEGNVPGNSDTICPQCQLKIIERNAYDIRHSAIKKGICSKCGFYIEGVWE